ncbi:MAG: acyl-CoA dehydrogenase, partial [Proteobacteria bacterium]|nr:acyl-CoA dehydrogenase [Pseudomonadota bacterium]
MAGPGGAESWEVTNQVPVLAEYDAFAADPVLPGIVSAFGADWTRERLHEAGRTVGSARVQELACLANRYTPELRAFDPFGNRIDEIAFHPAWHELMGLAIGQETHALAWNRPEPGAQVAR